MNQLRPIYGLILIAIGVGGSCDQPQIDFPKRTPAIEGTYQADTYYTKTGVSGFYPIQGQTMTLKLRVVTDDSVRVEIIATAKGDYSPGNNMLCFFLYKL